MRPLVLSEGREEAEDGPEEEDDAAGDPRVPHVGELVDVAVAPPVRWRLRVWSSEVPGGRTVIHLDRQLLHAIELLQP